MESLNEREKRRKLDTFTREYEPNKIVEEGTKADKEKVKVENIQFDTDRGDRYLTIQQYVKPITPSIPETVEVKNLAWDTTERDIRKFFSELVINSVHLGKHKETGEFKGHAHVDFKDSVSVAMALKLDQLVISGSPVKINCGLEEKSAGDNSTNPTPNEANNGNYVARTVRRGLTIAKKFVNRGSSRRDGKLRVGRDTQKKKRVRYAPNSLKTNSLSFDPGAK
ncbi:unnamed protein product [Eruca vesicaria subsp. sativa]|uniref:RRM domain-containing protein n=1 Tax=Eruca vesicaria subsp. sativa TaxID=29727 RepID=A0ABC8KL01_ERUVS|nr:unnamed protein product [Eruca vesicaria subsp. sativa]